MPTKISGNHRGSRNTRPYTYAHMKYKVGNRHFWSRGYYVSIVGANKQAVQKYMQHQETEDLISNQISMVEYYDPFRQWLEPNSKKKDESKK